MKPEAGDARQLAGRTLSVKQPEERFRNVSDWRANGIAGAKWSGPLTDHGHDTPARGSMMMTVQMCTLGSFGFDTVSVK